MPVSGRCDEQFAPVGHDSSATSLERGEVGAAVPCVVDGEPVVDLVGGWVDAARTRPWRHDTLVDVYSVGKAVVALLVLQLVDAGRPRTGRPGGLACGRSSPPAARGRPPSATPSATGPGCRPSGSGSRDEDLWDCDTMAAALAATEPWWEPGTRHAYHTNTYGHLIGGIVRPGHRRAAGDRLRPVADRRRRRRLVRPARRPSRAGAPTSSGRLGGPPPAVDLDAPAGDELMVLLSYFNPPGYSSMGVVNTPEWRATQIPSTNSHATAAGVARVYQALLEPGRLLSPGLLAEATSPQSVGLLPGARRGGHLRARLQADHARRPFGPNPSSFGHFGTGGAVGFADPDAGVAFGYVMNHVIPRWQSSRNRALIDAVYRCL